MRKHFGNCDLHPADFKLERGKVGQFSAVQSLNLGLGQSSSAAKPQNHKEKVKRTKIKVNFVESTMRLVPYLNSHKFE